MITQRKLNFNDPAPDAEVVDANGQRFQLSTLWENQAVVLAFIRHFGCPQCKTMLEELRELQPELTKRHLSLVVVTQGKPAEALAFGEKYIPGVLLISDVERDLYRLYGVRKGNLHATLFSLAVWRENNRAARKGYRPEMPPKGQDVMQMSAVFIIASDGRIRLPYYYDHIADHPPINLLLEGFLGMPWEKSFNGPIQPAGGSHE